MAGLKIVKVSQGFQWVDMNIRMDAVEKHTLLINENHAPDGGNRLLFTKTAREEMFAFIQWKNLNVTENRVEQGGLIAGYHYQVPETGEKISVAAHVFPLYTVKGDPGYWSASAGDWKQGYDAMDRKSRETGRTLDVIGWFHTHPNSLPTFMSGTDRSTQVRNFNSDNNYALVLNPHTGSWKAYRTASVVDAECRMLDTDDLQLLCREESVRVPAGEETRQEKEAQQEKEIRPENAEEKEIKTKKDKTKKPARKSKNWKKRKKAMQHRRSTRR